MNRHERRKRQREARRLRGAWYQFDPDEIDFDGMTPEERHEGLAGQVAHGFVEKTERGYRLAVPTRQGHQRAPNDPNEWMRSMMLATPHPMDDLPEDFAGARVTLSPAGEAARAADRRIGSTDEESDLSRLMMEITKRAKAVNGANLMDLINRLVIAYGGLDEAADALREGKVGFVTAD
jgi:hypothetical protein